MKKLFLLCLLPMLIGCTADPIDTPSTPAPADPRHGMVVSVEEALGELDALTQALTQHTRSGEAFDGRKAIRDIRVSGGSKATRSQGFDLPDTMAYVVNFADDRGFAVLGARRTLEPVYALTESGSFDADKLDAAIAEAQARRLRPEEASDTRTQEAERVYIGTDFAYVLLAEAMVPTPRIVEPEILETTYGPWEFVSGLVPLVLLKWNQTYPFNKAMPESTYWTGSYYQGRFPVGCSMVAAGQIMATVEKPAYAPAGNVSYMWSTLCRISNHANLDRFPPNVNVDALPIADQTAVRSLSNFLYQLGVSCHATYGERGTSASAESVIAAWKTFDPDFYRNARISTFKTGISTLYDCLQQKKPVWIEGWNATSGHAWVIDGFYKFQRTVTQTIRYSPSEPVATRTFREEQRFLHYNWGYRGRSDGYFTEGVFDMAQRAFYYPPFDPENAELGDKNYHLNNRIILY